MTATEESQGGEPHDETGAAGEAGGAGDSENDQNEDSAGRRAGTGKSGDDTGDKQAKTEQKQAKTEERQERAEVKGEAAEQSRNIVASATERALHVGEDIIYALTALVLVGGSLVVLIQAVWEFANTVPDGVTKAIEATVGSLLIVFILVELLSAVRSAILEHRLVAEPFLLVGILAAIKELVLLSTFKIESGKATETMLKIGGLAGVVLALGIATLLLRRKEREPDEG